MGTLPCVGRGVRSEGTGAVGRVTRLLALPHTTKMMMPRTTRTTGTPTAKSFTDAEHELKHEIDRGDEAESGPRLGRHDQQQPWCRVDVPWDTGGTAQQGR